MGEKVEYLRHARRRENKCLARVANVGFYRHRCERRANDGDIYASRKAAPDRSDMYGGDWPYRKIEKEQTAMGTP